MLPLTKLHKYITTHKTDHRYKTLYENKKHYINHINTCSYLYDIIYTDDSRHYCMGYKDFMYDLYIQAFDFNHQCKMLIVVSTKLYIKPFEKRIRVLEDNGMFTNLTNTYSKYLSNIASKLSGQRCLFKPNQVGLHIRSM